MVVITDVKFNMDGFVQIILLAVLFLLLCHQLQITSVVMVELSLQMKNVMMVSLWKMEMAVVKLVKFRLDGFVSIKESLNVLNPDKIYLPNLIHIILI